MYRELDNAEGITFGAWINHPTSSGTLRLRSDKPSDSLLIDPHYLEKRIDVDLLIEGKAGVACSGINEDLLIKGKTAVAGSSGGSGTDVDLLIEGKDRSGG